MVNEINSSTLNIVQNLGNSQQTEKLQQQSANKSESQSSSGESSDVTLTNTAEKLQALETQIKDQPVVDTQRVQAIKKSIFDGTFNLDSASTADKLATLENLLSSKTSQE